MINITAKRRATEIDRSPLRSPDLDRESALEKNIFRVLKIFNFDPVQSG
jgi:hypothetical protein